MPFPGESTRNFFKYIGAKYVGGVGFSAVFPNNELGDPSSDQFGGSVNYASDANWPFYPQTPPNNSEIKIIAATTLNKAVPLGGTKLSVASPYGIQKNMDCVLGTGVNAEEVYILKTRTNGSVTLEEGTTAAWPAGTPLIAFVSGDVNEPNAGDSLAAYGASMSAEDAVTLLRMLQDELQHTVALDVNAGCTTTNITTTAVGLVAGAEVGNIVTFTSGDAASADLDGYSARIKTNGAASFTIHQVRDANGVLVEGEDALPVAPQTGGVADDSFVITPGFLDDYISNFADSTERVASWKSMAAGLDPSETLYAAGGANAAVPTSLVLSAMHLYIEQLGGTLPSYSVQKAAGITPDGILSNEVSDVGLKLVTTGGQVSAGANPLTVEVDPRVGTDHLPTSGTMTLVRTAMASGAGTTFAAESQTFTRDGAVFTPGAALANSYPDGTYLIITNNNLGVKEGLPPEVDPKSFAEYLFSAFAAMEAYTILT